MGEKKLNDAAKFKIAHKEALIGCGLVIFNFLWWYGFAYGLGSGPPEEYTYILGFPAWFFMSSIVGLFLVIVIVFIIAKFVLKEVDFDKEYEDEDEEGENK